MAAIKKYAQQHGKALVIGLALVLAGALWQILPENAKDTSLSGAIERSLKN